MNNLHHLTSNDFYLENGSKGKLLCLDSKGLCLVCFHVNSDRCEHCEETLPEFKKLPHRIGNCKFALVNLSNNVDIVKMSRMTVAPIEHVPFIVLYVNGRPFLKYDGDRTFTAFSGFIQEVVQKLHTKQSFVENKTQRIENEEEIPGFSIAIPYSVVCDKDKGVCYLNQGEAYGSSDSQTRRR